MSVIAYTPMDDPNLTNELNTFYAKFDRGPPPTLPPSCDTPVNLVITPHGVLCPNLK